MTTANEENVPLERLIGTLRTGLRVDSIGAFVVFWIAIGLFRRGSHCGGGRAKSKGGSQALMEGSKCIGRGPHATACLEFLFLAVLGFPGKKISSLLFCSSICTFPFLVARPHPNGESEF